MKKKPAPTVRSEVCPECPFRREGCAGWLGKNDPESFAVHALSDSSVACHMMVDQNQSGVKWIKAEAVAPRCRGAIILMRNSCKVPRDQEMAAVVKSVPADYQKIFANSRQFIEFHESARTKSWELGE